MQIDGSGSISQLVQGSKESGAVQQQQEATKQQQPPSQPNNSDDTVTITNAATQLHLAEEKIASQPVVNTQRVEEAQAAIKIGSVGNNPAQVADKILHFESSLNNARSTAATQV